jgi:hypothetical protein
MTDLSITATSVVAGSDATTEHRTAGETITAGQAVYIAAATKLVMKADSNSASAEARQPIGIALNGGAVNQPIVIQRSGSLTLGATMTAGVAYYLSDTPGGICPVADIGSGEYSCVIGVATSTTVLKIGFQYSGVAL